jgi:16S rRNA (cytidine1402-2'-O)-methyltransferase
MPGKLYVVATPIGNLSDITERAIQTLKNVHLIACEDTRHTKKLLQHFGINTKTISYHEHNELQREKELIDLLIQGRDIAVVSDAGTPAINDPGYRIVRAAIDQKIDIVPIPGPSALITALVASGLPTTDFFYAGFLPARSTARQTRLKELSSIPATMVFYEAPHRLLATLKDALEIFGERQAVVARELTKLHEDIRRGRLSELVEHYQTTQEPRGEIVLLIDKTVIASDVDKAAGNSSVNQLVTEFESQGLDHRAALKKAARELGLPRAEAYRRLLAERGRS